MNVGPTHRSLLFACVVAIAGCLAPCACTRVAAPPALPSARAPAPEPDEAPGWFEDVTASSGLDFAYHNGEEADHCTLLETLGGGVGLLDYDGDGLLDVFLTGGGQFDGPDRTQIKGHPNRLYRNLGGWRFHDVTHEVGLDRPVWYGHGCAVADYDNDGRPDLLVTGYGRMSLYHNREGKRFEEVTEKAGLLGGGDRDWTTSAAWADLDGDGRPDLFVARYVDWDFRGQTRCKQPDAREGILSPPAAFDPLPQRVYRNNGDGTFRDVSREAGLKPGKGLGVLAADFDEDGRTDVYVASDAYENHLYLNRGGGRFEEAALARGVSLSELGMATGSMGVDAADCDGSGHLSLFVANYQQQPHDLYQNTGGGWFRHTSRRAGIMAIGLDFVGFGTGFFDLDHDGAEDLFVSNGHVIRYPLPPATLAQRPVLFRNRHRPGRPPAELRFEDVSVRGGPYFRRDHRGRGVAFGDLDNDGRTDIVISHCEDPVTLLRNVYPPGNHWLGVRLEGKTDRDAVGALLTLEVQGRRLTRCVKGGGSYLSSGDRRVIFGLGAAVGVTRLTVRWPSGTTQHWDGTRLGVDRYSVLTEGDGSPTRGP